MYDFGLLLLATSGLYLTYPLRRVAYANEKVSVLQPYAMLFQVFATLYFLTKLNPAGFYFIETILIIIFSLFLMFIKKEFKEFKLLTKPYIKLMIFTNTIVVTSILLSLTMYSNLGVVLTSLLSLLYLVFIYILGYFILGEKPSKKDIIVTLLVAICIIIGVIFKH